MPISFKSVTASTQPVYWLKPAANSNLYYANGSYPAGVYMLYMYPNLSSINTGGSGGFVQPSVEFKNAGGTTLASVGTGISGPTNTWVDLDTGSTSNSLFTVIVLTQTATTIEYNGFGNQITMMLQRSSDAVVSNTGYFSVTTITTSGSVNLTQAENTAWLLGGGGGGTGGYANAAAAGNGGGSGYLTTGSLAAGTYTATIGAGGAGGPANTDANAGSGGTTSIGALSAAGGAGGKIRGNGGGEGGSGGGGGTYQINGGGGPGGNGGFSGSSGILSVPNPGNPGGTGSGVASPSPTAIIGVQFATAGGLGGYWTGVNTSPAGQAGGIYAGGGGGYYAGSHNNYNGGSAAANTGGGGGGANSNNGTGSGGTGGNGGSGVIYIKTKVVI